MLTLGIIILIAGLFYYNQPNDDAPAKKVIKQESAVEHYTKMYLKRNPSTSFDEKEIIAEATRLMDELKENGVYDSILNSYVHKATYARLRKHPARLDPLKPVLRVNGKPFMDLNNEVCRERATLADKMMSGNSEMYRHKKKEFAIIYCYRAPELQAVLYAVLKSLPNSNAKVALPGKSFHNSGLAFDVRSSTIADTLTWVLDLGIIGGCLGIEEDQGHFSWGEISWNKKKLLKCINPDQTYSYVEKKILRAKDFVIKTGKELGHTGKKVVKEGAEIVKEGAKTANEFLGEHVPYYPF